MGGARGPTDDRTIIRLNIDHFRRLLATALDPTTRQTVERLLAEAEDDLHAAQHATGTEHARRARPETESGERECPETAASLEDFRVRADGASRPLRTEGV